MDYDKELEKTKEKIARLQHREEIILHRKNILDKRAKMERQKIRNSRLIAWGSQIEYRLKSSAGFTDMELSFLSKDDVREIADNLLANQSVLPILSAMIKTKLKAEELP